jgi:hypothetical protein
MNRRQFVTALGGTAALATGYFGARVGDIRYSPERPTGETPRERIIVPLALAAVTGFVDPFSEVTLDRDTGRLRKMVDHRDVFVDVWSDEARGSPQTHASQDTNSAENG